MIPLSSVMRRAEDEDKRRKLSCTRGAVSCAGCAMDEAQREVRARPQRFFGDKLEDGREAQGRDERGGAGRRAEKGEVQVETRAPSSERQVWHHGAATPLNEQFTRFQHQQ